MTLLEQVPEGGDGGGGSGRAPGQGGMDPVESLRIATFFRLSLKMTIVPIAAP